MPRALYIDDTVDTCDCCGKTDLKKTVAISLDDGAIVHYGTTCAARNIGKDQRQIKQEITEHRQSIRNQAGYELRQTDAYRQWCEKRIELYAKSKGKWPQSWWDREMAPFVEAVDIERQAVAARYNINESDVP